MDKKINIKALLLSLAIALVCCVLLFNYINSLQRPVEEKPKVVLLVASRNIEAGELITQAEINAIEVSEDSMPVGILNDRKEIEDFYAREPIIMGEPFRAERLTTKEELSLSWNVPEGMRAISVFVNEDSIFSNLLRVGDRVDLVGSFTTEVQEGKNIASSMIIVQNAEVLAIGAQRIEHKNTRTMDAKTSDDESKLPRTVTLAVTPGDAEKVVFASDFGQFSLILRGHDDDLKTYTDGVLIEDVTPDLLRLIP